MSTEENDLAAQIMNDVRKLERSTADGLSVRRQIVDKLAPIVNNMTFDLTNDKSTVIEAKTGLINTLLKAISDTDDSQVKVIKLKTSIKGDQAKEDSMKAISRTVAEFAKQLSNQRPTIRTETETEVASTLLEEAVEAAQIEISEGELTACQPVAVDDRTQLP